MSSVFINGNQSFNTNHTWLFFYSVLICWTIY